MQHHHAVIFDLDGTLADTLADIAAAGNHVREAFDLDPLPVPKYRYLAGQGIDYLLEHALGSALAAKRGRALALWRDYYAEHGLALTRPFPGIVDLLHTLRDRGLKLGILSNKPDPATQKVAAHLFPPRLFDAVVGAKPDVPLKPDPTSLLALIGSLGLTPDACVYVGDTRVDMETGSAGGCTTLGVTWGFRDEDELRMHGADAIIHDAESLLLHLR